MSIANEPNQSTTTVQSETSNLQQTLGSRHASTIPILRILDRVGSKVIPVRSLADYVAMNPYGGFSDRDFLQARDAMKRVAAVDMLMPVEYYRQQFKEGVMLTSHIDAAIDEMVADQVEGAERIDVNQVIARLVSSAESDQSSDERDELGAKSAPMLRTFVQKMDYHTGSNWSDVILEEVSKYCSAHYDQSQAIWSSPYRDLPLYQAWKDAARHDRNFEILGVSGFRRFVDSLPHQPEAAIVTLLQQLDVPEELWEETLLCEAMANPGWSAWVKQQQDLSKQAGEERPDLAGLLAIRLAYQAALSEQYAFKVSWSTAFKKSRQSARNVSDEVLLRYAMLKANEIAYRDSLLSSLETQSSEFARASNPQGASSDRKLAQMVFCIDVRSQRLRRHLEIASPEIETFGFAGFFGLPLEHVPLGQDSGSPQVPVLLQPQFRVHEEINNPSEKGGRDVLQLRSIRRFGRKVWKEFQSSAAGCFGFVETTGLFYGWRLAMQSLGLGGQANRFDGIRKQDRSLLGPSLRGLAQQGLTTSKQVDAAESILRGIGIVDNFARLVVFCGHGSETTNNPLQAGLDCGACGGHSGEPNARFAAKLLNQAFVREGLKQRGISIPEDTQFVAALHHTTTEQISFFDQASVASSHVGDLQELDQYAAQAAQAVQHEQLPVRGASHVKELAQRSRDWSEVRPEWGLAGNAAFVVGPRALTKASSLGNHSFLHSYDFRNDPGFEVLEQIMTAPMIVAHMINMQYYASTVDPDVFGSGSKTIHNVVGGFGILSGNGGDLTTGLPTQSIHDGQRYQHQPLRLLVVINAPRQAIDDIIAKHTMLQDLVSGGWMTLIAVDDGSTYRLTCQQTWHASNAEVSSSPVR